MTNFFSTLSILAAAEGDKVVEFSDGGTLAEFAWLIPVVPLLAAFAIVFWGKKLPQKGWELAVGAMGFVGLYGTVLFLSNFSQGITYEGSVNIAQLGDMAVEWGWMVDGLSIMMYFVVGVVGTLVFVYARSYMDGDIRFTWFFASFSLFAGGMLVLVSAANFIQLIVGWELVGVASYLLIGHYWESHENSSAAIKAFLVNKVADVGLFIGAIMMSVSVGSFRFTDILHAVEEHDGTLSQVAFWAGLAVFIGAMGKSAQFPFHVWLPDAMAGPTPVSALMHAATMVTAGVYLVGRLFPFYLTEGFAEEVRVVIIIVGALTLFLTGLIALVQNDIKKVLAYSTLSQLGYMMAAMGAGAYTAGLFHLFTHAFFKALLFLGAGSVIHAVHSNNMSDMGGLRKYMPWTYRTFVVASMALAGLPIFAGFFSKDEILASLNYASSNFSASVGGGSVATVVLVMAIAGAFITAFYMTRTVALTFFGEYKGHGEPHESPKLMYVPLIILGAFSVAAGWINIPGITSWFTDAVGARFQIVADHHATSFDVPMLVLGLAAALGGIALGWRIWMPDRETQSARDTFRINGLYPLLENKYFIDDFYMGAIVRPLRGPVARSVDWFNGHVLDLVVNGAGFMAAATGKLVYGFDQRGLDGAINASAGGAGKMGGLLRLTQTGRIQQYVVGMFIGAIVIVAGFVFFGQ
ncbi:MAG: NADH-quinone oxidoreductase subunit L [Acidimicrobiia bacterium]|nr:NADH-quinone oxidoreductase subunit L [Acidimicrobiia bacterium]